jgi:hypothetical protein
MSVSAAWDNPFAVRHVRPGALPYLLPEGVDATALVRRFVALGRRGAVVGPHGSGKSTLLATLLPELAAAGYATSLVELHDGRRTLPAESWRESGPEAGGDRPVLVIDGYEQLGWLRRWRVRRWCRRRGGGLLVTAHRPTGLPTLWRTDVSPDLAGRVIRRLRPGVPAPPESELARRLQVWRGNFREVLFEMYDEHERARRG